MKMFKKSQKLEIMLQLGRYVSIDVTQHFGNNFKIFFKKKLRKKRKEKFEKVSLSGTRTFDLSI